MDVIRDRPNRAAYLSQKSYIEDMAHRFGLGANRRSVYSPFGSKDLKELPDDAPDPTPQFLKEYQSKVGCVNYLSTMTRPDVVWCASKLSQFLTRPGSQHMAAVDRVIQYL